MNILGLTNEQALEKHKDGQTICRVLGGGEVVGQEVDDKNHLIYIIKKDGELSLIHAYDCQVDGRVKPVLPKQP